MNSKSILFVSTVREWGGSEILWAETAVSLADKGYNIIFAIRYNGSIVDKLKSRGASGINIGQVSNIERVLRKIKLKRHPFLHALLKKKPQLVVISQGSNVDARYYMTVCRQQGVPYVTVAQLVANILWAFIDDETLNELRAGYAKAQLNYFVSQANLDLHNLMIGDQHSNAKIILNSFSAPIEVPEEYPSLVNGHYQIALVGRFEMFHKGHDLLLQLLGQRKWKDRPVSFNLYGAGPHRQLIERLLIIYDIKNVFFKGYVPSIAEVWKNNHLLILPSRMEGQSLALLEAMWFYRGAVVTDVGGARDLVTEGENGFIAAFPTVLHIDAALEKAWSQREQWEMIGKNAGKKVREVYQEHPVAAFTKELETVFNKTT